MNKADLVAAIAAKGLTKAQAAEVLDAAMESIVAALKNGEKVQILGFGTFSVVTKSARQGINPITKKPLNIPERKAVKFKAGAKMAL